MSTHNVMSPNQREGLTAVSTITGKNEYIYSTNHVLSTSATISGTPLPISGATSAIGVAIVDGSGNQITSFGGGTQYTDGGTSPTHPIGPTLEFNNAGTWATVGSATPLPVSATFSPSGTQDINLKQINGNTTSTGNGTAGTGVQRVTIASDNTAFSVNATLSAETTKVIGTVNQGTSPWVVGQSTAANLNATVVGTGTFATQLTGATNNINNISGSITLPTGASTAAQQIGLISTNNSSTATLTSGSTFTGTADDASAYAEIRVTVFSDQASATNGLSIQQSTDNTNWDITDTYTIAASTGKTFAVPRQARYIRVVYTNGGTNQGVFRLQTILNRLGTSMSSQRSQDSYTNETDLQEMWAFNSAWNGSSWDRIPGSTTGLTVKRAQNNTSSLANVASSNTTVTLLSANTSRQNFIIYNDSTSDMYVKYGTTASSTSFTYYLPSLGTLQDEFYAGRLDGIWISTNGNARVTEVSI